MAKTFNVTGDCKPDIHYMVNINRQLSEIKELVDSGKYFTINRARQYGKTTTLRALGRDLQSDYYVISLDFQTFGAAKFKNENTLAVSFASSFLRLLKRNGVIMTGDFLETVTHLKERIEKRPENFELKELFEELSDICGSACKPIVLMIDEVDSAASNQVFLDFLGQLRAYYIDRDVQPTFQTVILAGVYDVKNLRRRMRPDDEHKVNSPWNIAADFDVDMSLSEGGIAGMLAEYEDDYHTGMNISDMARSIYNETSGYPFLVSKLCKLMDEEVSTQKGSRAAAWTLDGFMDARHILVSEKNTLFESIIGKVINYPELDRMLKEHIFNGRSVTFTVSDPVIDLAAMFGIIKNVNGFVVPANKIFDTILSNYYLSLSKMRDLDIYKEALQDKNQFIDHGKLNMRLVLEKFTEHFTDLYGHKGEKFIEEEGRKYFLLYLRPIINGVGNYSMEALTRSLNRTDLSVYYNGEIFLIEMKIWRGPKYHETGENQLLGYMDDYHQNVGYLVTFNFNKKKAVGVKEVRIDGRILIEATI